MPGISSQLCDPLQWHAAAAGVAPSDRQSKRQNAHSAVQIASQQVTSFPRPAASQDRVRETGFWHCPGLARHLWARAGSSQCMDGGVGLGGRSRKFFLGGLTSHGAGAKWPA